MVKNVVSCCYYAKEVEFNGRQELLEVCLSEMKMKEIVQKEWRHCLEVELQLVDMDGEQSKELSPEEVVARVELLRDSWLQIADGL